MNTADDLLRRALEVLEAAGALGFGHPPIGKEIRAYLDDAEEPTHMNFKGLTLEEMESCIKGNLTITDPNLREGVIASIIDAEHLLMEKNTNGDEPAALKEEE